MPSISFGRAHAGSQLLTETNPVRNLAETAIVLSGTSSSPITSLHATRYNRTSLALRLPKRNIPEHARDNILRITAVRASEPEKEIVLFARYSPGSRRADIDVSKTGASHGELFRVKEVSANHDCDVVQDYNMQRDGRLKNTRLRYSGSRMFMEVDGLVEVELSKTRFRTHQSELIMDMELDSSRMKMTRDVEGNYFMRLKERLPVTAIRSAGSGVVLTYANAAGEHTRFCRGSPVGGKLVQAPVSAFQPDWIRVLSRPDGFEGEYVMELSDELRAIAVSRLSRRKPFKRYTKERGDLGEELIDALLHRGGCPQLMGHPLDPGREWDSSLKGPDSLRRVSNGLLAYFEFKWWKDVVVALSSAREQAKEFPVGDVYPMGTVGAAYIANLDWSLWDHACSLTVSRVL